MAYKEFSYPDRFPPGTTVSVYLRSDQSPADPLPDKNPSGSVVTMAVADNDGIVSLSNLEDNTRYVAYALVNGTRRFVSFIADTLATPPQPAQTVEDLTDVDTSTAKIDGNLVAWDGATNKFFGTPGLRDIKRHGIKGGPTNVTADTTKWQSLATNYPLEALYVPPANYYLENTVNFSLNNVLIGAGRNISRVFQNDATKYAMYFAGAPAGSLINRFGLQGLSFESKYGVKVNRAFGDAAFGAQDQPMQPFFRDLFFKGGYETVDNDPNAQSASAVPTLAEMEGLGVGLRLARCLNATIENVGHERNGLGIILDQCDVANVIAQRAMVCGVALWHTTGGGNLTVMGGDYLSCHRLGWLRTDVGAMRVLCNHFEGTGWNSDQYIRDDNSTATLVAFNKMEGTLSATTPVMSFAVIRDLRVTDNVVVTRGFAQNTEFRTNKYSQSDHVPLGVWRNNPGFAAPNFPGIQTRVPKQLAADRRWRMDYEYWGDVYFGSGAIDGTFPWAISATTGKWVIRTDLGSNWWFRMPLGADDYGLFRITGRGRKITNGGPIQVETEQPGSIFATILSSNFGWTDTAAAQEASLLFTVPSGLAAGSQLRIKTTNQQAEYEWIEVEKVTGGGQFRGAWAASTPYHKGDIVTNATILYAAKTDFVSGATFSATNWDQIATGAA